MHLYCFGCVPTDESEGLIDYEDKFPHTYGGVEERQPKAEETNGDPGVTAEAATEAPHISLLSLLSQKHMFWFPSEAFQDKVTQRDLTVQSEESKENESQEMNSSPKPIDPDDSHQESDHPDYRDTDDRDDHDGHRDAHHERDTPQDYGDHVTKPKPSTPAQHKIQDRLDHPRNQDRERDNHYDMGEHDGDHSRTRYTGQEHDDQSYEDHEDVTEDRGDDDQEHLDDSQEHPDHDDEKDRDGDKHYYDQKESGRDHYTNTDEDDYNDGDDQDDLSDDHDDPSDDHDDPSDDRDDPSDDHDDPSDDRDDHDDPSDDHDDLSDDHDDLSDDRDDHDDQHHPDHDHDDLTDRTDENDHDDQDDHHDNDDHGDHKDEEHNSYEDHDSHEDVKDGDYHVIFSITRDHHQNRTEMGDGGKATTDNTWLDGYPVVAAEMENEDSMVELSNDEDKDTGAFGQAESYKPVSHTSLPEEPKSSSKKPPLEQEGGQEMWPGFIATANPTLNSYREHAAPTHSWSNDLTRQSFINKDPAKPVHDSGAIMEEHTTYNLPGESGERGEMEGEIGETVCTGENCPPPASAGQSTKVAAIIVVVCLVAIAVMVGVWCYRWQQQKSSVYEMNGEGQSQSRPTQQMEMQQKV